MSDLFPETIETDRLLLKRLSHETVDRFEYHRIRSSDEMAEIATFLLADRHETVAETEAEIDRAEADWTDGGPATYVVRPTGEEDGAGEIAGVTRLHVDWDGRRAEPALWLRKRFWGRGYSAERAGTLLAVAFERLDLELVDVHHDDDNDRSRRAVETYVEEFGGRHEGTGRFWTPIREQVTEQHRYTITRAEYEAATE